MKRLHVALAVDDFAAALREYSGRLGAEPCCVVEGTYALWRTDQVNLSVSFKPEQAGQLRHLGFEDPSAEGFTEETDTNRFVWERFASADQDREIVERWPHAKFRA